MFGLFPTKKELEQAQIYNKTEVSNPGGPVVSGDWLKRRDHADSYFGRHNLTGYEQEPEFVEGFKNWVAERDAVGDWAGQQLSNLQQASTPTTVPQASPAGSSMQERTRRSNVNPTGDNVVIVEPDRVVAAAPTPSASSESAYVPTGEAFYKVNKGDNLWNLTGGDTELINKIAAYNNLDPNKIYADADLRLKNEWLTPSSRLLNNTLAGIRYPG